MLRKILVLMIIVGGLAGFASFGSALFTDSQAVDANTFTSGTVILSTDPTTALVTFSNMAPGDQDTMPITVSNDGTLALRYAVTSLATDADNKHLNAQLVLTIKSGVTACTDADFGTDGIVLYSGVLGDAITPTPLIGDATAGADTGDRILPPTTSNTDVLCVNVILPDNIGNAFQGAATTATFTFAGEQTASNP